MRVERFLEDSAERSPGKVAAVAGARSLTYAQIDDASNRLAAGLRARGVRRGDRVVIHLENSLEAVISIFAVLKADAIFVVLNPTIKATKLAYILDDCQPTALMVDGRWTPVLKSALERAKQRPAIVLVGAMDATLHEIHDSVTSLDAVLDETNAPITTPRGIDIDLAALVYTSGSTGVPKGVMLSHLNIVSAATSITSYLANTADDVIINVLPLSFDYGLYQVLMAFKVGARIVLERSFAYPTAILETIVREKVTGFPIVPTIAALLLRHDMSAYDLSSLRYLTNTGAALAPAQIEDLRARLPHVLLYSMYGLTECKRVCYLPPEEIDSNPTSVGRAMDNVEVFLVDESGNRLEHGVGELVIRGSNVMQGYWNLPEETAQTLRPGTLPGEKWLYSNDIFRMDERGYLYFVGRRDDIIKTRGEKVSPREVENVLYELAGVVEAAVVGAADPILGQAVKAFVSIDPDVQLSQQDVTRHCAQRLEDFMVPKIVQFVPAMPRTSSGKIDRKQLEQQWRAEAS